MKSNFKVFIKLFLQLWFGKAVYKIRNIIDSKKIISFDVFDTLIQRTVKEPTDIFDLVEEQYNNININVINGYKGKRIEAEKRARLVGRNEEVTLKEIYDEMYEYPIEVRNTLMELERKTEYENCFARQEGKYLYEYARNCNKKIIIISDMYLDEEDIRAILHKNEYHGYIALYVSSKYGLKKKSGNLFKQVMLEGKYNPRDILHIGDNPVSDGISAKKEMMFSAILLPVKYK